MRIDMTTRQWHQLIKPVMPHAASDADQPELACIRLEATERVLYAIATDRYTLAVERLPIDLGVPLKPIDIRLSDAKASLGLFPFDKHSDPKLKLTIDMLPIPIVQVGRTVTVDHLGITIESDDGTRLVLHDQRNPDHDPRGPWRHLIRQAVTRAVPAAAPALTINASQLGRWAAAVSKGERLDIFTGTKGDEWILILVEDHFAGVWQPQQMLENGEKMLAESPWAAELEIEGAR